MNKSKIRIVSFCVLLIFICSCQKQDGIETHNEPVPFQKLYSSADGLTCALAEKVFITSPSSILTTIQNTTNNKYFYGHFSS